MHKDRSLQVSTFLSSPLIQTNCAAMISPGLGTVSSRPDPRQSRELNPSHPELNTVERDRAIPAWLILDSLAAQKERKANGY
jgi:hypothetical protein